MKRTFLKYLIVACLFVGVQSCESNCRVACGYSNTKQKNYSKRHGKGKYVDPGSKRVNKNAKPHGKTRDFTK